MTINHVSPDSILTEYHNGTTWVDISAYVVSDISGNSGFATSEPDDRVATLGVMELELNNVDMLFTPYGGDAVRGLATLTGFNKGAQIRTSIVIDGESIVYWTGRIDSITSDDGTWGSRRVQIICVDYMNVLTRFPMKGTSIQLNKRINEAATSILAQLSIQPEGTDFDTGDEIFPAVFSNVKEKTKGIGELNKLTMSELGYAYPEKDGTLRIENSSARKGTRHLDKVPLHPDLLEVLGLESGHTFLLESGDELLLEEAEEAQLALSSEKQDIELKNDIWNAAYVRAYPTRTATSLEVVFRLGSPIAIAGKSTRTFIAHYTNPSSGQAINATNQQAPVVTTDYLMNTLSTGLGSDISVNLAVTAVYYGDIIEYTLTNNNAAQGWVTKLQARGYGIYYDNPIEKPYEDTISIDAYGDTTLELDQRYKTDYAAGYAYAKSVVEEYKVPKSRIKRVKFLANLNHEHLMACTYLDIGDLIKVYEPRSEMYNWYYITGRSFVITLGKIIRVVFSLVEAASLLSGGLIGIPVDMGNYAWTQIDYGYCPKTAGLTQRSVSAWVYPRAVAGRIIWTITDDTTGGFSFAFGGTNQLQLYQKDEATVGIWLTPSSSISTNQWYHLVFTRDRSIDINADPIIYINGAPATLTESSTPNSTAIHSDEGLSLKIGSVSMDALLEDVRMYNTILTQADVTELYNAGAYADVVPDGMVFQSQCLDADEGEASDFSDGDLPDDTNVVENIFKYVGIPHIPTFSERSWTLRTTPNASFVEVAWSPSLEKFAAVGNNAVMVSSNAKTWTSGTISGNHFGICWSEEKGIFVAVGASTVKTSANGTSWTTRTAAASNDWRGICYSPELDLFVATSIDGTAGQRVMTSPDGTTWTLRNGKGGIYAIWVSELGLFISCDYTASTTSISTSPDGITWTDRTTPSASYYGLAWSPELGRVVCVGDSKVLYSDDGITWTNTTFTQLENWRRVAWSGDLGIFMAVGDSSGLLHSQYSSDGITWTGLSTFADYGWYGITYSPKLQKFVAVQYNTSNTTRVMTF